MTTQSIDNDVTQDTISMFFDVDFDPAIYVDTLFQSILANQPQYSKQALSKLSSNISYLITHLDYYTNELSTSLQQKLEQLEKNSNLVLLGPDEESSSSTRLQYYVSILNNSILSLQSDLEHVNLSEESSPDEADAKHPVKESPNRAIDTLILLKLVKANILQILELFAFMEAQINQEKNQENVTPEQFQLVVNKIYDVTSEKLLSSNVNQLDLEHINRLIDLQGMFVNLESFYSIYKRFANKLAADRATYLSSKRN